jgi:hypothetical protein
MLPDATLTSRLRSTAVRVLFWALALTGCALVFAWYMQPGLMLTLADRLWSCF